MTPEWVTAGAAVATTVLALVIAAVNFLNWRNQRQERQQKLELTDSDWEMLHILTRDDNGLLSFSIDVDWDSAEGNVEDMPGRLELPGDFTRDLQQLVAKGILYKAPGESRRKASFRFTAEGQRIIRRNKEKVENWYDWVPSP